MVLSTIYLHKTCKTEVRGRDSLNKHRQHGRAYSAPLLEALYALGADNGETSLKKLGGVLLVIIGVVLILLAVLRIVSVLFVTLESEMTAYSVGTLVGLAVIVILLLVFGLKSIKKGKSMYTGLRNADEG